MVPPSRVERTVAWRGRPPIQDHRPLCIIGPGRLGRSLERLFQAAGRPVSLLGRTEPRPTRGIVLLTVPDAAIAEVAASIPRGPAVLHTSGATDLEPVRQHTPHGSLHPLMTFPGPEHGLPDLHDVPAAIAGDARGLEIARGLARILGMRPVEVPGDRRLYHAAAVLAGNGATILLGHAQRCLLAAGVPADEAAGLLLPLVLRSLTNAGSDPIQSLTGPIARGDRQVIQAHLKALRKADLDDVARLHDAIAEAAEALLRPRSEPTRPER